MSFKITSERHGQTRVYREPGGELLLVFGKKITDSRRPYIHRHALTEHDGYTEVSVPYLNGLRGTIHDEHVDRARAMRDRLDNDTVFLAELDAIAKKQ